MTARTCEHCDDEVATRLLTITSTSSSATTETAVCAPCEWTLTAKMSAKRWRSTPLCPDCGGVDVVQVDDYLGNGMHAVADECRGCDWHSAFELVHEDA